MGLQASYSGAGDRFDLPRLCRYFSEHSPQPMVAVEGSAHVIRYLNSAFARLSGKTAEELLGRAFDEVVPEGAGCVALLERVLQTGLPAKLAEQEQRQTPPAFWSFEMWAIVGADENPIGVMIQVADVTETSLFRREATAMNEALMVSSVRQHELLDAIERSEQERRVLQVKMFEAQKLESLGVLAGGIAHDLNNILTPVLGFAELAAHVLPVGSPAAVFLEEVSKNGRRAADLVQQILAYSGKSLFVLQLLDLSKLVGEMHGLLRSAVASHIRLEFDLCPRLPLIEADSTQLSQVILNLTTNAGEAIAEREGVVTVRTGVISTDSPPAVFLEVADTGCGMSADVMGKIFDPFFTTKFTGRGLGLAVVQGIARGHHGVVQVQSELGKGSVIRITLPVSTKAEKHAAAAPSSAGWVGTGTVLVVDDDKMVCELVSLMLQQVGLTVLVARTGQAGLDAFRARPQDFHAVVLDLTMPQMGGLEVAEAMRKLRADIPIVLMSGYSATEVNLLAKGFGISGFVQKPFQSAELLSAVRRALGQ